MDPFLSEIASVFNLKEQALMDYRERLLPKDQRVFDELVHEIGNCIEYVAEQKSDDCTVGIIIFDMFIDFQHKLHDQSLQLKKYVNMIYVRRPKKQPAKRENPLDQ